MMEVKLSNWGDTLKRYLCNVFWLLVPVLVLDAIFTPKLPPAYQMSVFWKDIPQIIAVPENVFRSVVLFIPLFMPLRLSSARHRLGLGVYIAGLLLYSASWGSLIIAPETAWNTSALGFMGPTYTPALFLLGIGFFGDRLTIPQIPFRPWIYWVLSAAFLLFHNLHSYLIYARGI